MAAQIYLVTKAQSQQPEQTLIDGIYAMLINADDGSSDAVNIAEAVATAVAAGHPLHSGYFDTIQLIGPPTLGIMTTNEDAILFLPRSKVEIIA